MQTSPSELRIDPRRPPEQLLLLFHAGVGAPTGLLGVHVQKFLTPLGQRGVTNKRFAMPSIHIEHLNAIVAPVGYVYVAIIADVNAGGTIEFTVTGTA